MHKKTSQIDLFLHFDDNPWTGAENVKEHEWLLDPNCKIWPEK